MAISLSAGNLFDVIIYISTFLLGFTFILVSFINGEPLKSLIYLASLVLSMFLVVGLLKFEVPSSFQPPTSPICGMWSVFDDEISRPAMSTFFIAFTLAYIVVPMILSNNVNPWIVVFVLTILCIDTVGKYFLHKCITTPGLLISLLCSLVLGSLISFGIYHADKSLVYFGEDSSNNTQCGKRGKKFVCSVYKNGQLIKNL